MLWQKLFSLAALFISETTLCNVDEDCSLNGVCTPRGLCQCDKGWTGDDCGALDLRPAKVNSGYNLTAQGTSSWGSTIVHDPRDDGLYHLFAAEFEHGCGLDYWAPYSRIIRAESRNGPTGPYDFVAEILPAFAHNPTVIYSPADDKWLLYYIGCKQDLLAAHCTPPEFTCGPGNALNGESGISMLSSLDLQTWHSEGRIFSGVDDMDAWDADRTNPTVFPLGGSGSYGELDPTLLLVYRGCTYNCSGGPEQISIASSRTGYKGPYTKLQVDPVFPNPNEDPFLWRDKRGHYHMLLHSLERNGGFGDGPKVGRHAFARNFSGPWTFGDKTLAFSTEVHFNDGSSIDLFRRERPQLYFSTDGDMTPLLLTNGAQARNNAMSYSIIVPIGDEGEMLQGS